MSSKYTDDLSDRLKMNLDTWPHLFTKDDKPRQVGVDQLTGDPIMVAPMVCIHCHVKYINGMDNRPPDPCPARSKKSELKRILN